MAKINQNEDPHKLNRYRLSQNYPNPFNPITTIQFSIPTKEYETLKIFNILGEEVFTLLSASLLSGSYKCEWSRPAGIAGGLYLYRLQAGDYIETRKMILTK